MVQFLGAGSRSTLISNEEWKNFGESATGFAPTSKDRRWRHWARFSEGILRSNTPSVNAALSRSCRCLINFRPVAVAFLEAQAKIGQSM